MRFDWTGASPGIVVAVRIMIAMKWATSRMSMINSSISKKGDMANGVLVMEVDWD